MHLERWVPEDKGCAQKALCGSLQLQAPRCEWMPLALVVAGEGAVCCFLIESGFLVQLRGKRSRKPVFLTEEKERGRVAGICSASRLSVPKALRAVTQPTARHKSAPGLGVR